MLSYGALKLLPVWDPLRGDPRFEKIVGSFAASCDVHIHAHARGKFTRRKDGN
jgi:hypothetical protein